MPLPKSQHLSSFKNSLTTRLDNAGASTHVDRPGPSPSSSRASSSWTAWAGQKIKRIAQTVGSDGERTAPVENIYVFPGWASRRYHDMDNSALRDAPFDVQVAVSGWCSSHNAPGALSRSQRAFIRLAKGYASLPKLPAADGSSNGDRSPMSQSTEDLIRQLHLPPPPSEMNSEESEMAALAQELRRAHLSEADLLAATAPPALSRSGSASSSATAASLGQMHANLEARLLPFWSSVLAARVVRLALFIESDKQPRTEDDRAASPPPGAGPLAVQHVQTAADGSFAFAFGVPWTTLCTHPGALALAFGDPTHEHTLVVRAELLAPPPPLPDAKAPVPMEVRVTMPRVAHVSTPVSLSHSPVRCISDIDDTIKYSNILSGARSVFFNVFVKELHEILIPGMPEWYNAMWQRGVRFHYVSNGPFEILPVVTDFFRISQLPPGSVKLRSYAGRALFGGLFTAPATRKRAGVLDVLDSFPFSRFVLVGDSGEQDLELYAQLAFERPRQVLAVFVRDVGADGPTPPLDDPTGVDMPSTTFTASPMPTPTPTASTAGLVAAGGGGILSASLRRSETMSSTSSELAPPQPPYAAEVTPSAEAVAPRRGSLSSTAAAAAAAAVPYAPYKSRSSRQSSGSSLRSDGGGYFTQAPARGPVMPTTFGGTPVAEEPEPREHRRSKDAGGAPLSEPERRQQELQARVHRARALIPAGIPLRIFRDPKECVEAAEILDRLHIGHA